MSDVAAPEDEVLLLDLLNSTPVADGGRLDLLTTGGEAWARAHGGVGSAEEVAHLRQVRDGLQAVVRGPEVAPNGLAWALDVEETRRPAARALLAWGRVQEEMPGRLRACANDECRLFLLDRSRPNTARWCSMKTCGNRLKARRHYQRTRPTD